MVKREEEPITSDEVLIRRFNCGKKLLRELREKPHIPVTVFTPRMPTGNRRGDPDGLSTNRLACIEHPKDVVSQLDPDRGAKNHGIVEFTVKAVHEAGLSVEPDPVEGGPPGHCLIPELNSNADERLIEDARRELQARAQFIGVFEAGSGDIVP